MDVGCSLTTESDMDMKSRSDAELLSLLIGKQAVAKRYRGRLAPLMVPSGDTNPPPRLAAAVELTRRLLRESLEHGPALTTPREVSDYLIAHFLGREYETFVVIFLDGHHRVIDVDEMFRGSIDGAEVHPREVVRSALQRNAAACIFAHNHPSGVAEPSRADRLVTERLKGALAVIDVRVLDHFVIGGDRSVSFAERGLL